jgi:carboxymethylenebutenolidase
MTDAIQAQTVTITGHDGEEIPAYLSRPLSDTSRGGVVVIHHMPGYDEATKEIVRKLAVHGYAAICPNLHHREAPGASPDDAAAATRAAGGVPDDQLVGDVDGAANYLNTLAGANGKIGVIGYCSGGRQAFLSACSLDIDAAVDCYGAYVVEDPPEGYHMKPLLGLADKLSCPLLGLFGVEDEHPSAESVATLDAELNRLHKRHEFHSFEGAGHSFFAVDRPAYRPAAATDGWQLIFEFLDKYLNP